jgi:hypothetical protein
MTISSFYLDFHRFTWDFHRFTFDAVARGDGCVARPVTRVHYIIMTQDSSTQSRLQLTVIFIIFRFKSKFPVEFHKFRHRHQVIILVPTTKTSPKFSLCVSRHPHTTSQTSTAAEFNSHFPKEFHKFRPRFAAWFQQLRSGGTPAKSRQNVTAVRLLEF